MSMATMALKEGLNQNQLLMVQGEFDKAKKSKTLAYVLWFFLGCLGGHRFYSRNTVYAIFMLITLGGCGIWALIDVFFIGRRIDEINDEIETQIIRDVKLMTSGQSAAPVAGQLAQQA